MVKEAGKPTHPAASEAPHAGLAVIPVPPEV